MEVLEEDMNKMKKKKVEVIEAAILQLIDERNNNKKMNKAKERGIEDDEGSEEESILLSRLLSQLDSLKKERAGDHRAKEVELDEIVKEIKNVKRQNFITHCLLMVMIIITATWQLSEVSLLLNVKEKLSNPMRAIGDMIIGPFKGKGNKNAIEAPPLPHLNVPDIPLMDLTSLYLNGGDDDE